MCIPASTWAPFLDGLPRGKNWLRADPIVGITVAPVPVPQSMIRAHAGDGPVVHRLLPPDAPIGVPMSHGRQLLAEVSSAPRFGIGVGRRIGRYRCCSIGPDGQNRPCVVGEPARTAPREKHAWKGIRTP